MQEFRQDFFLSCSAGVFCVVVVFGSYQVYLHVIAIHGFDQFCVSTILEILNFDRNVFTY